VRFLNQLRQNLDITLSKDLHEIKFERKT